MQDELPLLIRLQTMDAAVDELQEQAAALLPLIQSKMQAAEKLKTDLKTAKESLSSNQLKKKQLEGEAEAKEKLVQKHQSELNSLKSNDAYKAMLGEIQAAKQDVSRIEDQILVAMEAIESDDRKYKELEQKFKQDESAIKMEIQSLETQKNNFLSQASTKKSERDAFASSIPAASLSQYDTIREQRGGLAIVPLLNKLSCGGCRMGLPPAKVNDVVKGKSVVLCDTCNRILYNPTPESVAGPVSSSSGATSPA